jgi:DNA (cytosine-5)-methyltransferase 1
MITSGDFLAGGGGVTEAMSQIDCMDVKWVLNHDPIAIRTNLYNHKRVKHYWADITKQDEHEMEFVDFMWASIECTQHSQANGGREKKIGSYMLGWELVRYVKHQLPYGLGIENVPEFKKWTPLRIEEDKKNSTSTYSALLIDEETGEYVMVPNQNKKGEEFERWKNAIKALGYDYHEKIMNAADYGLPTRRVRYFAFFTRKDLKMQIKWPQQTHNKYGTDGLKKWVACKNFIDMTDEGESIFARQLNPNIRKGKRVKLSENTLRRIAGGIKKYAPELYFIFQYYGNGKNIQSVDTPLNTVTTKDRHVLVTMEKLQFIDDHCHSDCYNKIDEPLNPQLTRQIKKMITAESKFISKGYSGKQHHASNINDPLHTITTVDHNTIISASFISKQYNSNGNPEANNQSIEDPLGALTTKEKVQFITTYFNSGNNPGSQNQSIDSPLNAILTGTNKQALITAIENGEFDFDIKMRFLDPEELSRISTFPEGYFTDPRLRLTKKEQVKLIGNAVPPAWAKMIIEPVAQELDMILNKMKMAI